MKLEEKLENIRYPKLDDLKEGHADSIPEFWDNVIAKFLPSDETIMKFHKLLIDYVNSENAVFAIRTFNNATKNKYSTLRRGFYNKIGDVSFFYTDNFFTAYFAKMAIDGYVPTLDEFKEMMVSRKFPARYGPDTKEERELMAFGKGKNVGITESGYKIAHILPVGGEYLINDNSMGMSKICKSYFPRGERLDWKQTSDKYGDFYLRTLDNKPLSKEILIAIFLRTTHPINYFLVPKTTAELNDKNVPHGIGEYKELIKYAHNYYLRKYPYIYKEYLKYVLPIEDYSVELPIDFDLKIDYGIGINPQNHKKQDKTDNFKKRRTVSNRKYNHDEALQMAKYYLLNTDASFRKAEMEVFKKFSPVRGGGFIAKTALNNLGIDVSMKGILQRENIETLINNANDLLKESLIEIKNIL